MSRQATLAEYEAFDRLAKLEDENPFLYIHRPIVIYERKDDEAVPVERRTHLDLLIDKRKRTRRLLHRCDGDIARRKWHDIAKEAKRIEWPVTCYAEQLPMILDYRHKVVGIFGGNRSGKTHGGLQWFCDKIVSRGGMGAEFWFVAYEQKATDVGVQKLVKGQNTGGRPSPPIIPHELVVKWPKNHLSADQNIYLVDGSRIAMKYASREGENLMGYAPVAVLADEGARIKHEINHTVLLARVLDAKGQVGYSTTPAAGHWLETAVFEPGMSYEEAAVAETQGKEVDIIACEYSMTRNPWQDPKEIEKTIRVMGGPDSNRVQREVFGRWVSDGTNLWSKSFSEERNTYQGPGRDASDYGLNSINKVALGDKFRAHAGQWCYVGGMDFNFWPMSLIIAQVVCDADKDQSDRSNWSLLILDEVVRKTSHIYEFASWLQRAGMHRGVDDAEIYKGIPIICDATGAHKRPPANHNIPVGGSLAKVMNEHGFSCKPVRYSKKNRKPQNPSIIDSVSLCHLKLKDGKIKIHADRCPNLIYSLKHQLSTDKGIPEKESNTASDRLSGPIDGFRYLVWSIWGKSRPPEVQ